jgi:hypothetical protein
MWKKLLMGVGAVGLFFGALAVPLLGYATYEYFKAKASSVEYVSESVLAIASNWSKEEFRTRFVTEIWQSVSEEELDELFLKLSTLGDMKTFDGPTGQIYFRYNQRDGRTTTGEFTAKASFENAEAEIKISIVQRRGDGWRLTKFFVDSPFLGPFPAD